MRFFVFVTVFTLMILNCGAAHAIAPARCFLPIRAIASATDPSTAMAAGDIDNDGDIDLVVANDGSQNRIYRNNGHGIFQQEDVGATTLKTRDIKLVDMDNDGDLDIITAEGSANGNPPAGLVYLNDGTGHYGASGMVFAFESRTAPSYAKSIAAGDLNGDGKPDVAIAFYGKNRVCIQGSSVSQWTCGDLSDDEYHTTAIAIADIDRDFKPDIITGNADAYNTVFFNNGTSIPATRKNFGGYTDSTYGLAIGDTNQDGRPDIVVGNYNGVNHSYSFITRNPYVISSFGDFTHKTYGISVGDIDKDGDLDVFIANDGQDNLLMKNNGSGFFHNSDAFTLNDLGKSYQLVMADLNGDHRNDLACADMSSVNTLLLQKRSTTNIALMVAAVISGHHQAPPTKPAAPSQVTAHAENDTYEITLHWRNNSNNADYHDVYISQTPDFSTAHSIGYSGADSTSFPVSRLEPCTTYYFWIAARNDQGQTVSTNYAEATTAPSAPTDLYTTNYTIRTTTLYWTNTTDQCTVRYHIYAKHPQDNEYQQIPDQGDLTDGTAGNQNINITPETYIYYLVAAENSDGTVGPMSWTVRNGYRSAHAYGGNGNSLAAVGYAFGDQPKYPWASTDQSGTVTFTWDDVPLNYSSDGSAVTDYADCFKVEYQIGSGNWVLQTDCLQNPFIRNNWQYQRFDINDMPADTTASLRISTHYLYNGQHQYSSPIVITGKSLPAGGSSGGTAALGSAPWVTTSKYYPGMIMVGWTTSNGATRYEVYRGAYSQSNGCSGAGYSLRATFNGSTSHFNDNVGNWEEYCYKARACNSAGCTDFSAGEYGSSGGL